MSGRWLISDRFDPTVLPLADRHYNRQTIGSPQFVPPGRCLVLMTPERSAFWITSWPRYARHEWPGAWCCTAFRNERSDLDLSSDLIREAVAATRARWSATPALGMVTFVDPGKVKRKRDPGRCFLRAGFEHVGWTKVNHLRVLQMTPASMPDPAPAVWSQGILA